MLYFMFLSCSVPKDTTNGLILEPSSESENNAVLPENEDTENNSRHAKKRPRFCSLSYSTIQITIILHIYTHLAKQYYKNQRK